MQRFERLTWMMGSGLCGAALMYLLDPERGRRRRHMTRDRFAARWRRVRRAGVTAWRGATAEAYGASQRMIHLVPRETDVPDDETLRQRVESQLFRDRHVPKGDLNITCEHGTVILRGELDTPAEILSLESRVASVAGVRNVHNLLHPHGTPAPNKERSRLALS
jgi:BON domain